MLKIKKILLFIIILISLNLTKLPVEVKASERLGINLFRNQGFEKPGKFNFAPFIVKYNKDSLANVFAKGEIVDGVGIGGSRALEAELMPKCSGRIYGTFAVNPGSTYRLSAYGRRTEKDDNPMHLGVRNYDETKTNSEAISGQFDTLDYQYRYVDFVVGKKTTEVEIFIYYPKPKPFYQTGGYIDELIIQEITYPPTINPIYDPTTASSISGTAEPEKIVKITLPNKTEKELKVEEDGTFNLPISLGTLKDGDTITAVQYGLYGVESVPEESTVAEKRLGKNLFQNPGFELPDNFNFAPFEIKYNSFLTPSNVFQTGEIRNGIGSINPKEPTKNRALYLRLMPHCEGTVPGVFSVNSLSNYRVSAEGRRWEDDDGKDGHVGVRGFNAANQNLRSGSFDTLQYKYRYVDFLVGNNTREVEAYIYVPKSDFWYQADLYIDNFVIEETAFPPDIDPIDDASATRAVTGKSDPGTKVKISLSSGEGPFEGNTGYDGIYSIPVPIGVIKDGTIVTAIQYGIHGAESEPSSIIARDTAPPPAPTINAVRDIDKVITGKSEPYSTVRINSQSGYLGEAVANAMGVYSLDLAGKTLIAGEKIYAIASEGSRTSGVTITTILKTDNTIIDETKGIGIYAENFILDLGDVLNLTDEAILSKSKARAFKIDDADNSSLNIEVNSSELKNEVGPYKIFLNVEEVSKPVWVSVIDGNSKVSEENDLVIYAKGFSVKKDNVPGLDIARYSGLKAWKLSDGSKIESVGISSALKAEKGKYNVKFNIGDVTHTIEVEVLDLDDILPEIYHYEFISNPLGYNDSVWTNKDIVIKLLSRDNIAVDPDTYEISTDSEKLIWNQDGLSNATANNVIFTISSETQYPHILARVKDMAGNYSKNYDIKAKLELKIDKTFPHCNYEDGKTYPEAPGTITFGDDLSGIYSAKLDGKEIASDSVTPEERGEHILVIIDNAGNKLVINFIIGSINTEVKIDGVIYSDGAKVSKIKRRGELTPETSVILKNIDTKNEYIGFLKYGETLVFKELPYGEYEIFCINPADIIFVKSSAIENKFLINQQNPREDIKVNSKFIKLNGFGEIIEENNKEE